jgi:hypothetical protein
MSKPEKIAEAAETAEAVPPTGPHPFIMTADERLSQPGRTNIVITGASGSGKTTLARTLPAETTLFIDLEAGTKALADWRGDIIKVREAATKLNVHPWELCRALACIMCGPDPAADPNDTANPYSQVNYNTYCQHLGGPEAFAKYTAVFWDSATVAARHCFAWCQTQPEAFSERTGKPDNRGTYGLHGRELVRWLTTIQHIPDKSTIVAAILNSETDDLRNVTYSLQIDGGKAKTELPGIFDNIATLAVLKNEAGEEYRTLVCTGLNHWGYLAKDRSGALAMMEPPDLAHIIEKSSNGPRRESLVRSVPDDFKPVAPGAFNPNK